MVHSLSIKNFRAFGDFRVEGLSPINMIVGDNGVGKTTLLEAIFLAAGGNVTGGLLIRQWRGLDIKIQPASAESVVQGIFADLFHDPSKSAPIEIELWGEGAENRHLTIKPTKSEILIPVKEQPTGNRKARRAAATQTIRPNMADATVAPIEFIWRDHLQNTRNARVVLSSKGMSFEGTEEKLPQTHMFAAQVPVPAEQSANLFSRLRQKRDAKRFVEVFERCFEDVTGISVETYGGSPALMVDVPWAKGLLPLPSFSGGTNRAASIMLALAQDDVSLVLVDEVESGIYHRRQQNYAQALIELSRAYKTQLVMTTHSQECIDNFIAAAGDRVSDIAFWRLERAEQGGPPLMSRFTVEEFQAGMALGDMR
jgi:Fe-S cluster assembly ATPase SufC